MKEYRIYALHNDTIIDCGMQICEDKNTPKLDENFVIVELGSEPSNLEELTIHNGKFVNR